MKRLVAGLVASLAVIAGAIVTPSMAYATDYGVDLNQTCQLNHGAGYVAKQEYAGAYGWRCWVPPWGVRKPINVQEYCTTYGLGTAVVLDANNAYSWRCRT